MIINRLYENQNLLLLYLVSFLVGLRTYQHPCSYAILCALKFPDALEHFKIIDS